MCMYDLGGNGVYIVVESLRISKKYFSDEGCLVHKYFLIQQDIKV